MTVIRKVMPLQTRELGDDEVEVIISTGAVARDGHIFDPKGADLTAYRKNPIVLWQHDADHPVGRADEVRLDGDKIVAKVRFAPAGISHKADEIRGLVKSGIICTMSVGMDPLEMEPLDPAKPRGGQRMTKWELLECSFCSVPVDPGAMVTNRAESQPTKETSAMKTTEERAVALAAARTRMLNAEPGKLKLRGLMNVARLACSLDDLGYLKDSVAWEAECEGDNSPVPAMIGEALKGLGDALIAMTAEEVKEMLSSGEDDEASETVITVETRAMTEPQRAFILAGKSLRAKTWRLGLALARAGKTISATTKKGLEDASSHLERALKHHGAAGKAQEDVTAGIDDTKGVIGKAQKAHDAAGEALQAAKDEPEKAPEHVARAIKAHKQIGTELSGAAEAAATMSDRHQDAGDSHRAMERSMKSCQRCMRAIVDGASATGEDEDSTDVQKSGGTDEDKGSSRSLPLTQRQREAEMLELAGR